MTSEKVLLKAHLYLKDGRIKVSPPGDVATATSVQGAVYRLHYRDGTWECSCPSRLPECAHAVAVDLVTDMPTYPLSVTQRQGHTCTEMCDDETDHHPNFPPPTIDIDRILNG